MLFFHEECAAMITMKHKLAYIEAKALRYLMTRSHFIEILMILTKYVLYLSVRLTEFSVTVESVTLRFYCTSRMGGNPPSLPLYSHNCLHIHRLDSTTPSIF